MILWVDPGIRKLWYALIDENRSIIDSWILLLDKEDPSRDDQYSRILEIHDFFKWLFATNNITTLSIEKYFFTVQNRSNAEFVYWVRGVLWLLAKQNNCKIKEYNPIQLKKLITWNGKASKQLMQKMIMKLYKLQDLPAYHDASDALALAWLGR